MQSFDSATLFSAIASEVIGFGASNPVMAVSIAAEREIFFSAAYSSTLATSTGSSVNETIFFVESLFRDAFFVSVIVSCVSLVRLL